MTGLNICNNLDRRMMTVLAVIGVTLAVFFIVSVRWGADGFFFIPIVMSGVIRVAARAWITEDKKDAMEADFFNPPRPSRFYIMKAGPIEGAPIRAPIYIGDIMGFID
jgi:hypothetical protein